MLAIQLDFFEPYNEFAEMKIQLHKVKLSTEAVRRGVFSRVGDIAKHVQSLYDEIEVLKMEIAKLKRELK